MTAAEAQARIDKINAILDGPSRVQVSAGGVTRVIEYDMAALSDERDRLQNALSSSRIRVGVYRG